MTAMMLTTTTPTTATRARRISIAPRRARRSPAPISVLVYPRPGGGRVPPADPARSFHASPLNPAEDVPCLRTGRRVAMPSPLRRVTVAFGECAAAVHA